MFPAVLLALVLPALRERDKRLAALTGAAIALAAAPFLPAGLPVLLALAGMATLAIRRTPSGRNGAADAVGADDGAGGSGGTGGGNGAHGADGANDADDPGGAGGSGGPGGADPITAGAAR